MGRQQATTVFIFANDEVPDTLRGYRLASQLHLAEGLGFKGGETEKVLYADVMMLSWNAEEGEVRPMLAPSIWYSAAGEMYLRDSFYALNGIHNRELNEKVFATWADNQGSDGAINTLVEPKIANVERKSNDSTPLWLMWALQNRRRFGTELDMDKIRRAAEYCLATYDPQRRGHLHGAVCHRSARRNSLSRRHENPLRKPGHVSSTAESHSRTSDSGNQRIHLRKLHCKAEQEYRSYYDATVAFLFPARNITDAIGFLRYLSRVSFSLAFQPANSTDEMVVNHLNHIPVMLPRKDCPYPIEGGTVRPIFIGLPKGKAGVTLQVNGIRW
jgi:hypothetical protein